jgi:uncharacterized protein
MDIPLFPLHTVLCPGIALPLHVFEPRYRLLTERCVAEEQPFGIVLIREGREVGGDSVAIAGVGTFAEIRQASRLDDGRFDLLVVGAGRFAIEEVDTQREPYLVASVTPLDDDLGDRSRAVRLASRVMRRFVGYLHLLQPLDGETAEEIDVRIEVETEDDEPATSEAGGTGDVEADLGETARRLVIPDDPTTLSYLLSGIVQVPGLQRQVLLETPTTEERLAALDELLDRELWLLRRRLRLFSPDPAEAAARRN